ncbi:MAG: helix-turn-helix domain-containing protein [Deltaproteobacteria bacterium]|nr:helix-turn-helix domain-containing protein [Deltaproteobacteria bacterium]
MKEKKILTLSEFGKAIGLSALDQEMIRQKNRLMDCLKKARIERGWSQSELAQKLGTQQPAIARMEAGMVGEVSFDFMIRVALALGFRLKMPLFKTAA